MINVSYDVDRFSTNGLTPKTCFTVLFLQNINQQIFHDFQLYSLRFVSFNRSAPTGGVYSSVYWLHWLEIQRAEHVVQTNIYLVSCSIKLQQNYPGGGGVNTNERGGGALEGKGRGAIISWRWSDSCWSRAQLHNMIIEIKVAAAVSDRPVLTSLALCVSVYVWMCVRSLVCAV